MNRSAQTSSALYESRVLHERFAPRRHRFAYRLFYLALDLDELPALGRRLRLFSLGGFNLFGLRERDYLPLDEPVHNPSAGGARSPGAVSGPARPEVTLPPRNARPQVGHHFALKQRVAAFCARHGVTLPDDARVTLVTLPRVLGYQFNPVSFYFCRDAAGAPLAAIAEVTNTFREMKAYFVPLAPARPVAGSFFHLRAPKHFYVSPFSDVDVAFDFTLRAPGEKLAVRIDDFAAGARTLHSTLTGERRPLTDARLAWYAVKFPLLTLRVIALIHWQALRLWLKRVPFFAKAARAADQRDLVRPHASLVRPSLS